MSMRVPRTTLLTATAITLALIGTSAAQGAPAARFDNTIGTVLPGAQAAAAPPEVGALVGYHRYPYFSPARKLYRVNFQVRIGRATSAWLQVEGAQYKELKTTCRWTGRSYWAPRLRLYRVEGTLWETRGTDAYVERDDVDKALRQPLKKIHIDARNSSGTTEKMIKLYLGTPCSG